MRPHLYLNASDVSSAIGLNPYRTPAQLLSSLRSPPIEVPLSQVATSIKEASIESVKHIAHHNVQTSIADCITTTIEKSIQADLPVAMIDDIVHNMATTYGTEREPQSIEAIITSVNQESTTKVYVTESNTKMFYKTFKYGPYTYRIGGKVDALLSNGKLIEIKNRINHFMNPIPDRDRVQLHVYMVLTNTNCGTLSEHLKRGTEVEIRNTEIPFDANFWNLIMSRLDRFVVDYYSV